MVVTENEGDGAAVPPALGLLAELGACEAWVLSTYSGCDIRCTYCIVSAQGRSVPRFDAAQTAARLRAELDEFPSPPGLFVGAFVDAYPSVEPHYRVTRAALEVLVERDLAFELITKGAGVLLDIDLFQSHRRGHVQISLCSLDEDAIREVDPGAPSAIERLAIIDRMVAVGVKVRLQISPWIPGMSDVEALVQRVDPSVSVQVTPLRLPRHLQTTPLGRRFRQVDVNDAYRREFERVGPRPNVLWSRPPALDGAPAHITDNLGSRDPSDWRPAEIAPRPGAFTPTMRRRARPLRLELLRQHPTADLSKSSEPLSCIEQSRPH
jgi:DNA repair photolyase